MLGCCLFLTCCGTFWWVYCCSMMVLCVDVFCHLSQVCRWSWSFWRFFSLADVYCFMLYYTLNKFSLMYLPVWFWFVLLIFIFWEGFLGGWLFLRFSFMVWFLSFVHLVKLFKLFWLVCLVSGDLMFRVLFLWTLLPRVVQNNTHILIVMCKTSKGFFYHK